VTPSPALPFITTRDTRFVDSTGQPVVLRGCNLGNWLLLEMWMLEISGIPDQYGFESILTARFGSETRQRLMEVYRQNFITERDFPIIKSFGFNTVRVPFEYRLIEDDERPFQLRAHAFHWLDRAVRMAEDAGLYVILDLHGAPGRQSVDHTTGRRDRNRLWEDADCQARTVWLWQEIARHFRHSSTVAGFDLLNEPFGDYRTAQHQPALLSLMDRLYHAIREVDPRRVLFIPGTFQGIGFYGRPADRGWTNVAFTEHDYPALFRGSRTLETIGRYLHRQIPERAAYLQRVQSPFLVGEFNVVLTELAAPTVMRRYLDEYAARGWAATMWSYKLLRRAGGADGSFWGMVANRDPLPDVDIRTSSPQAIEEYFRWLGTMDYDVHERLRDQITTTTPNTLAFHRFDFLKEPPATDLIPGWTAADIAGSLPGGQKRIGAAGLEVYGGGEDIWSTRDQFRFLSQEAVGDLRLTARIDSLEETHPFAKAGVMLRNSPQPDAALVLLHVFPNGRVSLGWRPADGAEMKEWKLRVAGLPLYLEIARRGEDLQCRFSLDGRAWESVALPEAVGLNHRLLAGLAVLGHDGNHSLTTAVFQEIELQP